MKKNVLQLIGSFHQGGSERQAVQLLRLLKEEGTFNLVLATLNKEGVLLREVEGLGFVKIAEFPLTSFFNLRFVRQVKEFAGFLRDNKIDILHTHDFYTNVFGILAAKYAGVSIKIASKRETKGVRSKNQEFIEKNIFKFADKIVSNSKAVKKYLTDKNVGDEKIEVVYNGVDLERLEPSEKDRTAICNSLSLPVDDKVKFITLVANLHHDVKNQEMLLRAAKSITKDFSNAHFVFAGEGSRKDKLEELAKEYGVFENSHFIGRCEKVPELLSISYTCVLTSTAEGFSNSILEYMAALKPVIATDVGGASEAIVDGKTGFLVESDDDHALAEYLRVLLIDEEKAQAFGKEGRRIIESRFSLQNQLEKTLEIYNS